MYFNPLSKLGNYVSDPVKALAMYQAYSEEMTAIHFGQGWDIHWHSQKKTVPSQAQYFQMVENKSSCLPRMTSRFICSLTDQDAEK